MSEKVVFEELKLIGSLSNEELISMARGHLNAAMQRLKHLDERGCEWVIGNDGDVSEASDLEVLEVTKKYD